MLVRASELTLALADTGVALPELPCTVQRFPFRSAGPGQAALAALVQWLDMTATVPLEALWEALEAHRGPEAVALRKSLAPFCTVAS